MPVSGIAAAVTAQPSIQQLLPQAGQHRHNGIQGPSMSDIEGQSSNAATPPNPTGKIGSVLDIRI